jgi:hypothetical protein
VRWAVLASVLIVASSACTGSSSTAPSASTSVSASASSEAPAPPTDLKATQPSVWKGGSSSWQVTLTWQPSAGADSFVVVRDGRTLSSSDTGTVFKDEKAEPGVTYRYQVTAVGSGGIRSEPATVSISTHTPSLSEARLSGAFVTKLHVTSQSGLINAASRNDRLFRFAPHCGSGACDVTWSEKGLGGSGVLHRNGSRYSGTVHAPFAVSSCFGARVTETLVFEIRITHAKVQRGEWSAGSFTGTLRESASTSGCVPAHLNYVLTGRLG